MDLILFKFKERDAPLDQSVIEEFIGEKNT